MRMDRNVSHDSVCRMLRHTLTLRDDLDAWHGLSA